MTKRFFSLLLLLLATWAALVTSQQCTTFSSIPSCAQDCITNAATDHTSCGATDWTCQCTAENHQTIQDEAENCCNAACGEALTMETVRPAADSFCLAVNAGEVCSTTSSASTTATTTATSMSSGTTTTASTTGTGTSTSSGTGTAASSPTASSTAGAAVVGPVGSFGVLLLGALAIF